MTWREWDSQSYVHLDQISDQFAKQQNGIMVVLNWILEVPHKLQVNLSVSGICGFLYNWYISIWPFLIDWQIHVSFQIWSSPLCPIVHLLYWTVCSNQHWPQGILEYYLPAYWLLQSHYKQYNTKSITIRKQKPSSLAEMTWRLLLNRWMPYCSQDMFMLLWHSGGVLPLPQVHWELPDTYWAWLASVCK